MSAGPSLRVRRSGPLRGVVRVPGDKSISHRALLFGALCDGPVEIRGLGTGGDNRSTAGALRALGVPVTLDGASARVDGRGLAGLVAPTEILDCGNSGTTVRLLAGLVASRPWPTRFDGDASLRRRPMRRLAVPLGAMGARLEALGEGAGGGQGGGQGGGDGGDGGGTGGGLGGAAELRLPMVVHGAALRGAVHTLAVASAQLKSALLLAGLGARGLTLVREPGPSRDHSERLLAHLGAPIACDAALREVRVDGDAAGWTGALRAPREALHIPGDLSSAAFPLVAAALVPGSDVTVEGVGLNPTRTGVLDVLGAMGADLEITVTGTIVGEPVGRVRLRARPLRGTTVAGDLALRALDEIPILAVAAAVADGPSTFADLAELRVKESDRLAAIARELGRAGLAVDELPSQGGRPSEGLVVRGGGGRGVRGGRVHADHDHRIAMAGAILGLVSDETTVIPTADIGTSFPDFADMLAGLGADVAHED